MTYTGAVVLFASLWFVCLFIALPIRVKSQDEEGEVVPGTPASAPNNHMLKQKFLWVTVAAAVLWAILMVVIVYGIVTVDDLDFTNF